MVMFLMVFLLDMETLFQGLQFQKLLLGVDINVHALVAFGLVIAVRIAVGGVIQTAATPVDRVLCVARFAQRSVHRIPD